MMCNKMYKTDKLLSENAINEAVNPCYTRLKINTPFYQNATNQCLSCIQPNQHYF